MIVGIDIGGTHFRIGCVEDGLQVSHFSRIPVMEVFASADPLRDLAEFLSSYLENAGVSPEAMVLGFPATVDRSRSTVLQAPNLPFLENLPVKAYLTERFHIPVLIERDVNLALYYDRMAFGLQSAEILMGCYFGTGIGNAIMIGGRVLIGANGTAGELGHIPVNGSTLQCGCGNIGCMEPLAGGVYLARVQQELFPKTPVGALFREHGSHPALEQMLRYMAMTIATEVNLLDPDCVLIGGGVPAMEGFPREKLMELTLEHTRKPYPAGNLWLIFTQDVPEKSVIGAALYAKDYL